jgi:trk system potassium uptake protein TrkH
MGLLRIPILGLGTGLVAFAMLLPALYAAAERDWATGRAFLYAALFSGVAAAILALALPAGSDRGTARREITALVALWVVAPAFAALPLALATPWLGPGGAWFEMIAAMTTTGGTAYDDPGALPGAIHLWRGLVGWLGGLVTLVAAYVILAPRRLGGFEIEAATWRHAGERAGHAGAGAAVAPLESRIARAVRVIGPAYATMTLLLGLVLSGTGQGELPAMVHAMAVISTSGISPDPHGFAATASPLAEAAAAVFMIAAATRIFYAGASPVGARRDWREDPEIWMMGALVLLFSLALFLRHWIGALTLEIEGEALNALEALWGTVFTVLSFLTTTGFESASWGSARDWSGLANPGLFLLALAAIGGGAATTAGGIKLIRAYALLRHGLREIERIAQPASVIGVGARTRSMLREGPLIVWSFIMLFIVAILAAVLGLTATGMAFVEALIAAIAAISNTGPAFPLVAESGRGFADLQPAQRAILAAAMLVGRIEVLALIALVNPVGWRRSRRGREKSGQTGPKPSQTGW